ncbi:MAG: hypothetical protein PXY39_12860 [archaeon]|nr:hypothetical protein [archaeon]
MPKRKINLPSNFKVEGSSVIINCSSPHSAAQVCDTWLRFIHAVHPQVIVEMIEAAERAPKYQEIDLKEYSPLFSCVKEIPHDDDHDYFRWRGMRFEASCPKCDWKECFPSSSVAHWNVGQHMKTDHNKFSSRLQRREWKQDWNCFKKNWV